MHKLSINEVMSKVEEFDKMLKDSGWERDSVLDLKYQCDKYRACLSVYFLEEEDEE